MPRNTCSARRFGLQFWLRARPKRLPLLCVGLGDFIRALFVVGWNPADMVYCTWPRQYGISPPLP
eukprot:4548087-Heterocapsa_arctica.AAC.1